jgi:hypothetical protein
MSAGRSAVPPVVLTVGHSDHPLERFLALLARHEVEALVDIRSFPGSRKHPHFHRDNLAAALPESGLPSCSITMSQNAQYSRSYLNGPTALATRSMADAGRGMWLGYEYMKLMCLRSGTT